MLALSSNLPDSVTRAINFKEGKMTSKLYLVMLIPAIASAGAFAQDAGVGTGKVTSEQVRKELIDAKHDGTYNRGNDEFPASEQTVQKRKAEHAAAKHPSEGKAPKVDSHDAK